MGFVHDDFGVMVKQARQHKQLTLRQLAKQTRIGVSYISRIENNNLDCTPSQEVVDKLMQVLQLDPSAVSPLIIRTDCYDDYRALVKEYPQINTLMKRMHDDSAFATKILNLL